MMFSPKFWVLLGYLCIVNIDFIHVAAARTSDRFTSTKPCSPADGINCTAYFLRGKRNCSASSLYEIFSDLYNLTDDGTPEKPGTFSVEPSEKMFFKYSFPGANVTMQLPRTSKYKDVSAFEFRYYDVSDPADFRCVIVDLSNNSFIPGDRYLKFKIPVWTLLPGLYYFEGYSFPKPPPSVEQGMNLWAYLKILNSSYQYVPSRVDSADWGPVISYAVKTYEYIGFKSIAMQFTPPPRKDLDFQIQLWSVEKENFQLAKVFNLSNQYKYEFIGLPEGTYTIKVAQTTTGSINITYELLFYLYKNYECTGEEDAGEEDGMNLNFDYEKSFKYQRPADQVIEKKTDGVAIFMFKLQYTKFCTSHDKSSILDWMMPILL